MAEKRELPVNGGKGRLFVLAREEGLARRCYCMRNTRFVFELVVKSVVG